jgi:hypothetical protein
MENAASQLNFSFGVQSEMRSWFGLELLCHQCLLYNIKWRSPQKAAIQRTRNLHKNNFTGQPQLIIQVNRGGKTTIEVKPTQLSNQQVHELVTGKLSNSSVPTFGGVGCEPASAS